MSTKPNRQSDEVVPIKYSGGDQFGPRHPLPAVGIVWCVRDGNGPRQIVIDSTPLGKAEPYGDFLTHPRGHYEVWESWRRLGPAGLARRGLPTIIAWQEYENFPRGRVVFDTCSRRFTVYADPKLQTANTLYQILDALNLGLPLSDVRSDPHYRTTGVSL